MAIFLGPIDMLVDVCVHVPRFNVSTDLPAPFNDHKTPSRGCTGILYFKNERALTLHIPPLQESARCCGCARALGDIHDKCKRRKTRGWEGVKNDGFELSVGSEFERCELYSATLLKYTTDNRISF